EGDKSLEYWRKAHINFFSRELEKYDIEFSEDMPVVFEEFEVVYK
ncbi:MAG: ASCH domain-containing protein, partial [Senegalia sp. (in: firmicutes)]